VSEKSPYRESGVEVPTHVPDTSPILDVHVNIDLELIPQMDHCLTQGEAFMEWSRRMPDFFGHFGRSQIFSKKGIWLYRW